MLFDRDGTLIHDVPYNADPDRVSPVAGAVPDLAAAEEGALLGEGTIG
ncbi:hypothetical protein [Microtetraspora sp. AC03309]|nr:hypothetical protein [Microtetraspora sp. AC03309]